MRQGIKLISTLLLLSTLIIFCFGCSRVTQKNFDKIKPNMEMAEVTAILGEPTKADSVTVDGFSGTSAVWKTNDVEIDIQFINNKVTVKSFTKLEPGDKQ